MLRRICGVWLGVLLVAAPLWAQSWVANPTTVEFLPSADHTVTLPDGSVLVQSYEFRIYIEGGTSPMQVASLGKPVPGTDGIIRASVQGVIGSLPVSNSTTYRARVAAIGDLGAAESAPSNPFGVVSGARAPTNVILKR